MEKKLMKNFQKKEMLTLKDEILEAIPILKKLELKKLVTYLNNLND